MARVEAFYSGRVQGVGFRNTAASQAVDLDLTGMVRNLPDGRVHLIAEGPRREIETLIERIEQQMPGHIQNVIVDWQPPTREFESFEISY